MQFRNDRHSNRIECIFPQDDPRLVEQIGLCVLVVAKYGGEIDENSLSKDVTGRGSVYSFVMKFDSYDALDDARAWLGRNLNGDGQVAPDYLGALPKADPGGREADRILTALQSL
jgi:hypothetical protein